MTVGGLVALCAGWIGVVAVLILDLAGVRRAGVGRRWQGYGLLLIVTGMLARAFAAERSWPTASLRGVDVVMLACILPGLVFLVAGLGIQFRGNARPADRG